MPFDALTYLTLGGQNKSIEYEEVTVGPSSIVSITDAAPLDAEDVVVSIEPVQDLHGYDNPWPAGGGKNLFSASIKGCVAGNNAQGFALIDNGTYFTAKIEKNTTYTITDFNKNNSNRFRINLTNSLYVNGTIQAGHDVVNNTGYTSYTFDSGDYTRIYFVTSNAEYYPNQKVQLELGSASTSWTPYSNICPISGWTGVNVYHGADQSDYDTLSITFPSEAGTVYGGTLDVTKGVLTVDRAMVDLGTLTWNTSSRETTYKIFSTFGNAQLIKDSANNWTIPTNFICSQYKTVTFNEAYAGNTNGVISFAKGNHSVNLVDSNFADYSATEVAIALSGVQLVYELATPVTYTLTPQQIALLRGGNTLWADTGDTTLTYNAEVEIEDDSNNNIIASHILRGKKLEDVLMMQQLKTSNSKT